MADECYEIQCFMNVPDFVVIVDQSYRVMTVRSSQHDLDPSSVRHLLLQHLNLQQRCNEIKLRARQ